MPAQPDTAALHRLEQALARSVRAFAARLRHERASPGIASEALLRRLGIEDVTAEALASRSLGADVKARIIERLDAENRRLVRQARRASPAYDLNRHMAVRRLIGTITIDAPSAPTRPTSGSQLNRRFSRRAHCRA